MTMKKQVYKYKKVKKKKERFTLILASNTGTSHAKQGSITSGLLTFLTYFFAILLVMIITYSVYTVLVVGDGQGTIISLRSQVEKLTSQNEDLIAENKTLSDKITLISETLTIKVEAEEAAAAEEAALYVPTAVPMTAGASMEEGTTNEDGTEVPVVFFTTTSSATVYATGQGTVSFAGDDPIYGTCVKIDHGNGYTSMYICDGVIKVRTNETVTRETILFEIEEGKTIRYQIILDDQYINPLDIMEIYG